MFSGFLICSLCFCCLCFVGLSLIFCCCMLLALLSLVRLLFSISAVDGYSSIFVSGKGGSGDRWTGFWIFGVWFGLFAFIWVATLDLVWFDFNLFCDLIFFFFFGSLVSYTPLAVFLLLKKVVAVVIGGQGCRCL